MQIHPGNVMRERHWVYRLTDSDAQAIALETASYRESDVMSIVRCLCEKVFHYVTTAIRWLGWVVASNVDHQAQAALTLVELGYRHVKGGFGAIFVAH
ncbi:MULTISPECIES: hypothetical protein [unclassified Symbiopectobacterium]|uniref:hypothetical protein n=1 Tax=unclassified Symbiopectobacterium TaxID=2794573 RepID=UPI00222746D8|nr:MULTISPECIES: hypothetical protein [unclassified Symbiopectobacterium]